MVSLRVIPWSGRDRRKHERTKVSIPCRLLFADDVLVGQTKDISLGGVAFAVELDPERAKRLKKQKARIALILPRGEIEISCKLVRVEERAVAVQYKSLRKSGHEDELREFLRTQLSQLV